MSIWIIIIVAIVIVAIATKPLWERFLEQDNRSVDFSVYERKPFLFDNVTELNLYRILSDLFGNQYHIFVQVNYSHLIQPKKSGYKEERRFRSSIDRKSADFVLCDKDRVVPQLIIELDGSAHNFASKQKRDEFINELTKIVGLPILHLKTGNLAKEFIKSAVTSKLTK